MNLKLNGQPQGAGGLQLCAKGIVQVVLEVTIEKNGVVKSVPFYILDLARPIW